MHKILLRLAMPAFALAIASGTLVAASPAAAATEERVGGCTVSPARPYIEIRSGIRYAKANVYVSCTTSRSGIVNGKLMEADYGTDDTVAGLKSGSFTIPAGQTHKVLTLEGRCRNFDPTGAEELYTTARINVGGINSSWAKTFEVSTTC